MKSFHGVSAGNAHKCSLKSRIGKVKLVQLAEQQRLLERLEVDRKALADYCQMVYDKLKQFTLDEKRQALEAVDIRVTWSPDKPTEIQGVITFEIASRIPWDARRVERSTGC